MRGVSKRPAYRVQVWRQSPFPLDITSSKAAAYREAEAQARQAVQYGGITQVQVMVREPGSRQWGALETVWRHGSLAPSELDP
jgi:hypothetical protein